MNKKRLFLLRLLPVESKLAHSAAVESVENNLGKEEQQYVGRNAADQAEEEVVRRVSDSGHQDGQIHESRLVGVQALDPFPPFGSTNGLPRVHAKDRNKQAKPLLTTLPTTTTQEFVNGVVFGMKGCTVVSFNFVGHDLVGHGTPHNTQMDDKRRISHPLVPSGLSEGIPRPTET